jgi:para-nitrobenzyl esterase
MTDAGDSGAIIVRQNNTTATGLNFAGNDSETIANPIYLAGWSRQGSIRFDGGAEIPMFSGSALPVPLSEPGTISQMTSAGMEALQAGTGIPSLTGIALNTRELCSAKEPLPRSRAIGKRYDTNVNPVIKTRYGEVRGTVADGVGTFKGIPYAAPPFGANRLRPPQLVAPWRGVREALTYGPKPPQLPYLPPFDMLLADLAVAGEDCLNLNIWSPDLGSARQPVMVWIAGGAFEHGTGAEHWYEGSRFARDGVVCVTINYRVGADGFLCLGDGNANRGLLDQVAALEWVQENIAAFGGDPGNVTIFGESAGAMSIGSLLSIPRAEGLFRRAILESGATHPVMSAAAALRVGQNLAEKLGVAATREAIAKVPLDRMLRAQAELNADLAAHRDPQRWGEEVVVPMMLWQPVIDGDVIPARPIDRIVAGAAANIDLMVGTNTDEWRFFLVPNGVIERIPDEVLPGAIAAYGLSVEATLAAYRAENPNASAGDLLAAIQSDWYIRIPAIRLADAHAKNANTSPIYMYEFAWRSPQFNGLLGACHALEIPFVFDTLGTETEAICGTYPPQQLADTMHAAWVAFAPMETAVGLSMTLTAGQPCGSMRPRRSWTILAPRRENCGNACVSLNRTQQT